MSPTFGRLMEIIRTEHHIDTSAVTMQTKLVDAGLDSLAVAELLFSIEEVFHVDLGDVKPEDVPATVGEIVHLIDSKRQAAHVT